MTAEKGAGRANARVPKARNAIRRTMRLYIKISIKDQYFGWGSLNAR